jgi:hypothetical protein
MAWAYSQTTGHLSHDGELIAAGYSGTAQGLNNPATEGIAFQGPIPRGTYTIGAVIGDGGHMGPYVIPLSPWAVNNMFGRAGFFIHGDNQARNHTASNGCIVLDRQWRAMIATSGDSILTVAT